MTVTAVARDADGVVRATLAGAAMPADEWIAWVEARRADGLHVDVVEVTPQIGDVVEAG